MYLLVDGVWAAAAFWLPSGRWFGADIAVGLIRWANCLIYPNCNPGALNLILEARNFVTDDYVSLLLLIERLHRRYLEAVKVTLDISGTRDINSVQAIVLFNIGDAKMTVGDLTQRGLYLGSNVSYILRKLVENGYVIHERSIHDRRSIHVRLSEKGILVHDRLRAMHQSHVELLMRSGITAAHLRAATETLHRLKQV